MHGGIIRCSSEDGDCPRKQATGHADSQAGKEATCHRHWFYLRKIDANGLPRVKCSSRSNSSRQSSLLIYSFPGGLISDPTKLVLLQAAKFITSHGDKTDLGTNEEWDCAMCSSASRASATMHPAFERHGAVTRHDSKLTLGAGRWMRSSTSRNVCLNSHEQKFRPTFKVCRLNLRDRMPRASVSFDPCTAGVKLLRR